MSARNNPQTPSISELWKTFEQRYSSGAPGAVKGAPKLFGARLESARREWVAELKKQVKLGCRRFSWPATPEDVGALKDLLRWDVAGLWREVNEIFSISAQDSNERPDPAKTSYKTWQAEDISYKTRQAEEKQHENYWQGRSTFHSSRVQKEAQQAPTPSPSPKGKSKSFDQGPDAKKPQSNTNDKEEFSHDKPSSVKSFPRLYGFTPKWPHKIWTLDDADLKLKRFALKRWIALMSEFNAMSLDYGQEAMHLLLKVRSEESAEKVFTRWDHYLQLLAERLYEDWEDAVRQWPKGDDDPDETVSTSAAEGSTDTDPTQTPTPAATPAVLEMKERNSQPLLLQKRFARSEENTRPAKRTEGRAWHDRHSKRKRRKRETHRYSKHRARHSESEDGSSMEEDEILYSMGRKVTQQSLTPVQPNRRTDDDFIQLVVDDEGRIYQLRPSVKTAAPTMPGPFSSHQRVVTNEASQRSAPSSRTPKPVIDSLPPPIPLATKPFSRPKISYPSMPGQLFSTNYWSRSGILRHTISDTTKERDDRHVVGPNVLNATETIWVEPEDRCSNVLDPDTEAEIEMMYADAARSNAERNMHAFQETGICTYSLMEEGHKLYGDRDIDPEEVSGGESLDDTVSSFEVTSEDEGGTSSEDDSITPTSASPVVPAKSWRMPPTWVEENFGNLEGTSRPASRAPDRRQSLASESSMGRTREKAVRWDQKAADVRYY